MSQHRGTARSIVTVALLASAAYACWKFLPPFAHSIKLRSEVKECLEGVARKARDLEIEEAILARLDEAGLAPEALEVAVESSRTGNGLLAEVTVQVSYRPVIEHPVVHRTTTMDFEFSHSRQFTVDW